MEVMPDTNFLAITLVYFLIVYLVAIRKFGHKVLGWVLVIAVQAVSVFYFEKFSMFLDKFNLFPNFSEKNREMFNILILAALNIIFILLINLIFASSKNKNKKEDKVQNLKFDGFGDIKFSDLKLEDSGLSAGTTENVMQDVTFGNYRPQADAQIEKDDQVFNSIRKLISEGKIDEANKSLRMIAFFGKDKQDIEKAKKMLMDLQIENGGRE